MEGVSLLPLWYDLYFNSFIAVCEVYHNRWMKETVFI